MSWLRQRLLPALIFLWLGLSPAALAQQRVGDLYATDASVKGSVILAGSGTTVLSGSQIAAGTQTATLKLERGGSVLVCPGTSLSVASSQNGMQLLFSMNTGNLELDYPIGSASDSLLTPDFRLLLPGPGKIHVAVRVSPDGDTCVQSLPMNGSALVVSEAMGDASYQVKQDQAVLFKRGRIQGATATRQSCGCPAPPPVQVARVASPAKPEAPAPVVAATASTVAEVPKPPEKEPTPPAIPETHLVVDAPFVFQGDAPPPDLTAIVAHLKLENDQPIALEPVVLPPGKHQPKAEARRQAGSSQAQQKRSFFSKIGAFLASVFH